MWTVVASVRAPVLSPLVLDFALPSLAGSQAPHPLLSGGISLGVPKSLLEFSTEISEAEGFGPGRPPFLLICKVSAEKSILEDLYLR